MVKSKAPEAGVRRVLCPVNFSEVSVDCARYSSELAERAGADLFTLQAIEQSEGDLNAAKDRLCRWHTEHGQVHTQVAAIVRHGDPVQETISESLQHEIDLIVVGARRRKLRDLSATGRTTEHIIPFSPISVLVVPGGVREDTDS